MTALNFLLEPERVVIFMDTLSLRTDKTPFKYASKIFPLPHLRGVICGTGLLNTIMDWYTLVEGQVIGNIMDIPNKIAPSRLPEIHSKYNLNETIDATIYHFGFNPRESGGRIRGFAFRSTNNFVLEELKDGYGIKPYDDETIKYFWEEFKSSNGDLVKTYINVMKLQKDKDDKDDPKKRIGIGGSIHMFYFDRNRQFIWECYNFDDYDETYGKMLQEIAKPIKS